MGSHSLDWEIVEIVARVRAIAVGQTVGETVVASAASVVAFAETVFVVDVAIAVGELVVTAWGAFAWASTGAVATSVVVEIVVVRVVAGLVVEAVVFAVFAFETFEVVVAAVMKR